MNVMSVKNSNKEEKNTYTKIIFNENNDVVLYEYTVLGKPVRKIIYNRYKKQKDESVYE